jgi:hypothetical protein
MYRNMAWRLDSLKMESASFIAFDTARQKYQLENHDAYYVHHMSHYEHLLHRHKNFHVALNRTHVLSEAAFQGECRPLQPPKFRRGYLALIPFYSGLPPNVTRDLKVRSLGQGNSLVGPETKALQAMATVCSSLKYFGQAVIGVSTPKDQQLAHTFVSRIGPWAHGYVSVVRLELGRPAWLPNQLLRWGQSFVKWHNCAIPSGRRYVRPLLRHGPARPKSVREDVFAVCHKAHAKFRSRGPLAPVRAMDLSERFRKFNATIAALEAAMTSEEQAAATGKPDPSVPGRAGVAASGSDGMGLSSEAAAETYAAAEEKFGFRPLEMIYFSESDQIVRFDDEVTFRAIAYATNETTFFTGRRKTKNEDSNPAAYMDHLGSWRQCGVPGFDFSWPTEGVVHKGVPGGRRGRKRK